MAVSDYDYGNTTDGYWKTGGTLYRCVLDGNSDDSGLGCAARVLETGNMNYPVVADGGSGS